MTTLTLKGAAAFAAPAIQTKKSEGLDINNPEALAAQVKTLMDDAKKTAETALAEVKKFGEMSEATKAAADKVLPELGTLNQRLLDIEQKVVSFAPQQAAEFKTMGHQFVGSDEFKGFLSGGGQSSGRFLIDEAKTLVTSGATQAGPMIDAERVDGVLMPRRELRIRNLMAPGSTGSNAIEYFRQTGRTNAAAETAEGGTKPESALAFELVNSPVQTIAHWIPVTRQAMDDAAGLASVIDSELRYGLELREDSQLLNGNGTSPNLQGIIGLATAYAAAFVVSGATVIDQLRLAILQAQLTDVNPDGIAMHPTDWARVELTKDTAGYYIAGNPAAQIPARLWGLPVVPTQAVVIDKFLVGPWRQGGQVFDRMATEVMISTEHSDFFVKNQLAVRAEKRLAVKWSRPGSFIYGDLGFV